MDVKIESSWKKVLQVEFEKDYFKSLASFVREEYKNKKIYPPPAKIFDAFNKTPFEKVKVVVLGQDPYHGERQANGLSFSVSDELPLPPSLQNIYKELESDIGIAPRKSGDLTDWADQGVLLLNTTLTVEAGKPGSHQKKGWEELTNFAIKTLSLEREGLVFMLWGKYAQDKKSLIDPSKHLILESAHPSPFSADRGFFGSRHFSQANTYLIMNGVEPIKW